MTNLYQNDKDGKQIAHSIYDAWGNSLNFAPTDLNHTGLDKVATFGGYTYDDVLRLYYAQNRFYDPENYRFTQEDPIKGDNNWYAYCDSNPTTYMDPYGLSKGISGATVNLLRALFVDEKTKFFGFSLAVDKNGIYSYARKNCWQRSFGYMDFFDDLADNVFIKIDDVKSVFDYDGKRWRIQCWKGRYFVGVGAEIGVYIFSKNMTLVEYFKMMACNLKYEWERKMTRKVIDKLSKMSDWMNQRQDWFRAARKNECRDMSFSVYRVTNKGMEKMPILHRKVKNHWWITQFRPQIGWVSRESLIMFANIKIDNNKQREICVKKFEKEHILNKVNDKVHRMVKIKWR